MSELLIGAATWSNDQTGSIAVEPGNTELRYADQGYGAALMVYPKGWTIADDGLIINAVHARAAKIEFPWSGVLNRQDARRRMDAATWAEGSRISAEGIRVLNKVHA